MQFILCILLCASVHQILADHCFYDCNRPDGNYAWCGTCTLYLACTDGRAKMMTCPDDLEYNMDLDKCVRASEHSCYLYFYYYYPCGADLCIHGTCYSSFYDRYQCECLDGWKGENCDKPIEPCQSTPTIYTIEAGQDKVTFFPEHGNCYNLKTITKNFCKGDCGGDVCTEISPKRRMYDLKCTDGFRFSTLLTTARECACVEQLETDCQLVDVIRKKGYFRFIAAGIKYINTQPVLMHECQGSCSPESRCQPNELTPVIRTLTARAGGTLDVQVMDPYKCLCNYA